MDMTHCSTCGGWLRDGTCPLCQPPETPPPMCQDCGRTDLKLVAARGLCRLCYARRHRRGELKTLTPTPKHPCRSCGRKEAQRFGLCRSCYDQPEIRQRYRTPVSHRPSADDEMTDEQLDALIVERYLTMPGRGQPVE